MKTYILGEEWEIKTVKPKDDPLLIKLDGYCDKSIRTIVVTDKSDDCELGDFERYKKQILRHEIIHAFLLESGLDANYEHAHNFGHDETLVDWFAYQFEKIVRVFKEVGCLDV